ncbi:MAG: thiamine-phosphate kinase [Candidatus Omnitrophota bacterium]|nr:thiamine-phosphate kinase [Candidatus Omnitrophota bacterium]
MNELDWIDLLKKKTGKSKDVLVGIGDDCAQVKTGKNKVLLKSDLFMEGVHFKKNKIDYKTLGQRAVCRVLSDFAACGGRPKFIGVSAGIPSYVKNHELDQILAGILFCGKKYKFSLVGGDTAKSLKLFLDIWGVGETDKFISRKQAKVGDYIFVTGPLGQRAFDCVFEPRIKEAQGLVKNFKVNSMIDISDGFIIDLYRVLKDSGKGACIERDKLPLTKGESDLYRGEDYELIFTVDKSEKKISYLSKKFHFIGRIKSDNFGYKMRIANECRNISIKGYTHQLGSK